MMTLGIRNGEKRKTCQEDLVLYSSPLSHLTQYQIADNIQSHLCQETLLKVPVQSTKCKSLRIAACKAEFLHHPAPPLSMFDKLFNLTAASFAICKMAIRNTSSPLQHCLLEFPGSSPAVLDLN